MSISFSCECGKKLAAKDNFAGRRLKCPGCGKSLTIPQRRAVATQLAGTGPGAGASTKTAVRNVFASPGFVHFACDCGQKMRARLAHVGEEVDCPRCGQELAIPVADGAAPVTANGGAPVKVAAPLPPPVTKRIEPLPPLTSRAPVAPATTRSVPAPAPITAKSVPIPDPHTSMPAPAPPTKKSPKPALPALSDTLIAQQLSPWRDDETRRQAGKAPPEPKVRSRLLLPIAALVAIALLAVEWYLVQASYGHARPPGEPSFGPLALIPAKAVSVTTYHVAGNDKSLSDSTKSALQDYFKQKNFAWALKDLERFTVIIMESDPVRAPRKMEPSAAGGPKKAAPKATGPTTDEITIVQTRQPYLQHDVLLRVLQNGSSYYRQRVGKRGYWRPNPWEPDRAVCFIDANTFAFGEIASVEHFVHEQSMDGIPAPLETTGEAALKHDFVVGLNFTKLSPFAPKETIPPLKAFRTAVVIKDDSRESKEQAWTLRLTYANANDAEKARRSLAQFKIPAEAADVVGSTLLVTLQVGGNDPQVAAFLGNILGVVHRNSTLRKLETAGAGRGAK